MARAAKYLVGRHDFSSFCASFCGKNTHMRTIRKIDVTTCRGLFYINVTADGFLTHMVRIISGTLLEAGKGRIPPAAVPAILNARDRRRAGPTLPAKGLCLMKVFY